MLGKIVNVTEHRVEHVLLDTAPRLEAVDRTRAFLVDSKDVLHAFDMVSGAELWAKVPDPTLSCRAIFADETFAYCVTRNSVIAFERDAGTARPIFASRDDIDDAIGAHGLVAIYDKKGQLVLIDPTSDAMVASRHIDRLTMVASPAETGICVIERPEIPQNHAPCTAECLDAKLSSTWSRTFPASSYERPRLVDEHHLILATEQQVFEGFYKSGPYVEWGAHLITWFGETPIHFRFEIESILLRPDGTIDGVVHDGAAFQLDGRQRWPNIRTREVADTVSDSRYLFRLYTEDTAPGDTIEAIDRKTGELSWSARTNWNSNGRTPSILRLGEVVAGSVLVHGESDDPTLLRGIWLFDTMTGVVRYHDER